MPANADAAQLGLFLKHMDGLPPAPERVWKAVKNPDPASRQWPEVKG